MRKMHTFPLTMKKLATEISLQGFDRMTDSALSKIEFTARLGKAATAGE
jgi:hypothetical protein